MADGAPQLLDGPAPTSDLQLATSDATDARFASVSVWGLYLNGAVVLTPDSIKSLDYTNDWRISKAPQEKGGFQSYNKVSTPFEMRIAMTKGGSASERGAFLSDCERIAASLDLYDVLTPEKTYLSVTVSKLSHHHEARQGANLLTVEFVLEEVRTTGTTQFTSSLNQEQISAGTATPAPLANASTPNGKDPVNLGIAQLQSLSQDQINKMSADIVNGLIKF